MRHRQQEPYIGHVSNRTRDGLVTLGTIRAIVVSLTRVQAPLNILATAILSWIFMKTVFENRCRRQHLKFEYLPRFAFRSPCWASLSCSRFCCHHSKSRQIPFEHAISTATISGLGQATLVATAPNSPGNIVPSWICPHGSMTSSDNQKRRYRHAGERCTLRAQRRVFLLTQTMCDNR